MMVCLLVVKQGKKGHGAWRFSNFVSCHSLEDIFKDYWQGSKKHQSEQFFMRPALQFVLIRLYEIWPNLAKCRGANHETFSPDLVFQAMPRNLWAALPLEAFLVMFRFVFSSWHCEKMVIDGLYRSTPLKKQSLQLMMILKKFHVWILMASLLPKVLKEFHSFTRSLDMLFGFHTNLNWSRQNILVRDVTGVGLVTDTLGITKNAEDETHEEWNWRLATKQTKSCSEMYSYFMCGYNWYCYSLETCLDFILTYSDLQDSVLVISIKSLTLI